MIWQGVYPAVTTQFRSDESIDLEATQRLVVQQLDDGVDGIIALGTCGENASLAPEEKLAVLAALREAIGRRAPLLTGVAETTTAGAVRFTRDAERAGVDGLMVLPALTYSSQPAETLHHLKAVAAATALPLMIYNNPNAYHVDITVDVLAELATVKNVVAVKEASEDARRITDLVNRVGARYAIFAGVDDFALEAVMLGAVGWVSGLTSAFPREAVAMFRLARAGRYAEALTIYRWFMPLLHLDSIPTLVQCIKLVSALAGRGTEQTRAPRLPLAGEARAHVMRITEAALRTRPALPA
ncbi:MAG: dihydrodipicolinate synthase family protein [Proteobacteria bacterium]|nr:dihydrodipicolinate synthase family protein [Pseudomonadota bacterium]